MRISDTDILIVSDPGAADSGHWQMRWGRRFSTARVVGPDEGTATDVEAWIGGIERAILMATRPVVLIAHSLGVPAVVHTAARLTDTKVRGAFLVAAPNLEGEAGTAGATAGLAPAPRDPLPFPSMLVASATDPFCSLDAAGDLANCWGSEFHGAGDAGHIDAASGHGPWPEGLMMFTRLMQRLKG